MADLDTKLKQLQAAFDIGALDEAQLNQAQAALMGKEMAASASLAPELSTQLLGDGNDAESGEIDEEDPGRSEAHPAKSTQRPAAISPRRSMKATPAQFTSWIDMEVRKQLSLWHAMF